MLRLSIVLPCLLLCGCATLSGVERDMLVTAYCSCGECNGYTRGSWKRLKLDVWNRYVSEGPDKGERYDGSTANGGRLCAPNAGLVSGDSLRRPWMIPVRVGLPWLSVPREGTIAADTDYYPFGTRMYVPGYGWGVVKDRGSAIQGPDHIDIFIGSHQKTNEWGRQNLRVKIQMPKG